MYRIALHTLILSLIFTVNVYAQVGTNQIANTYIIVDTGVKEFYSDTSVIKKPDEGEPFFGQDGHYQINPPSYIDNQDGTITDKATGLMWQKEMNKKMSLKEASHEVKKSSIGGHQDWRLPSIKELYSLILFTGRVQGQKAIKPFIDTNNFNQPLGNTQNGEREIDAQTWSSTEYTGKTMRNDETVFGVNFIDGRIKGYPKYNPRTGQPNKMYFRFVRGNSEYGINHFLDNHDGTVTDLSTGLMWQQGDSSKGMNWEEALKYAENLIIAGLNDWRLPNAKELQSIVDYSRSPQTDGSAAIDPIFEITDIKDPNGERQFPYYWSSTTHLDGRNPYASAVYVAFGKAQGKMHGQLMDVHGAGSQRSDPKSGIERDYPQYFGPQGDVRYVYNYVRCVRSINK